MSASRSDWTQDGEFLDGAGNTVRAYDEVTLRQNVRPSEAGNVTADIIPAGTRATVLFFSRLDPVVLQLECPLGENAFAFAMENADQVTLATRAEDKHAAWRAH